MAEGCPYVATYLARAYRRCLYGKLFPLYRGEGWFQSSLRVKQPPEAVRLVGRDCPLPEAVSYPVEARLAHRAAEATPLSAAHQPLQSRREAPSTTAVLGRQALPDSRVLRQRSS